MTVFEAIQANPVFSNLPESTIQYALDSRSISGETVYSQSSLKDVELVSADLYLDISLVPDFKEGQMSVKYNSSDLKKRAKNIYIKYDDPKKAEFEPKTIPLGIKVVE